MNQQEIITRIEKIEKFIDDMTGQRTVLEKVLKDLEESGVNICCKHSRTDDIHHFFGSTDFHPLLGVYFLMYDMKETLKEQQQRIEELQKFHIDNIEMIT